MILGLKISFGSIFGNFHPFNKCGAAISHGDVDGATAELAALATVAESDRPEDKVPQIAQQRYEQEQRHREPGQRQECAVLASVRVILGVQVAAPASPSQKPTSPRTAEIGLRRASQSNKKEPE